MTIPQLSIFIENQTGTLLRVLQLLKQSEIQIVASTIADTAEYGIFRLICTKPMEAYNRLREAGYAVALSDVFAVQLENRPGSAADAIETISKFLVGITYMYTFVHNGKAILIFRTDNPQLAREAIMQNNLNHIDEKDLEAL